MEVCVQLASDLLLDHRVPKQYPALLSNSTLYTFGKQKELIVGSNIASSTPVKESKTKTKLLSYFFLFF